MHTSLCLHYAFSGAGFFSLSKTTFFKQWGKCFSRVKSEAALTHSRMRNYIKCYRNGNITVIIAHSQKRAAAFVLINQRHVDVLMIYLYSRTKAFCGFDTRTHSAVWNFHLERNTLRRLWKGESVLYTMYINASALFGVLCFRSGSSWRSTCLMQPVLHTRSLRRN